MKKRILFGAGTACFALLAFSAGKFAGLPTVPALESTDLPVAQATETEDSAGSEDEAPSDIETDDGFMFEATAYCDFGITYSGVLVQRGIVAADPRILPIGSVIEVEAGDYSGIYTVMDTGGVVKGQIIDIYVPDYEEAIQFGRQNVRVRIIRKGWHPDAIPSFDFALAG
ncbi:MAG: 3D domain-containing protein [Acidobacteriota bacterium]|nr:MAG: 3D domain-containing protein [Acidobacteriota bacterium]